MYKQLFAIQALRHRQNGIEQGLRGQVPEDVHHDVMERIRPWAQDDWDSVVRSFRTMRVRLRSIYLPSNRYPMAPLLALAVEQLDPEEAPIYGRPGSETPLHISVAFYNAGRKREFDEVFERYQKPREVVLHGRIQGSTFELRPPDPIAADPEVAALKQGDAYYGHRPLHISL